MEETRQKAGLQPWALNEVPGAERGFGYIEHQENIRLETKLANSSIHWNIFLHFSIFIFMSFIIFLGALLFYYFLQENLVRVWDKICALLGSNACERVRTLAVARLCLCSYTEKEICIWGECHVIGQNVSLAA